MCDTAFDHSALAVVCCNWWCFQCSFGSTVQLFNASHLFGSADLQVGYHHHWVAGRFDASTLQRFASMICFNSGGISGISSRLTCIAPSVPLRTTMLILPNAESLSGVSSRK